MAAGWDPNADMPDGDLLWAFELNSTRTRQRRRDADMALAYECVHPSLRQEPLVDSFTVRDLSDAYVKKYFRFHSADDIELLAELLQMQHEMCGANGVKAAGNHVKYFDILFRPMNLSVLSYKKVQSSLT